MTDERVTLADAGLLREASEMIEDAAEILDQCLDESLRQGNGRLALCDSLNELRPRLNALADVLTKIPPDMAEGLRGLVGYLVAHDMQAAAERCVDAAWLFDSLLSPGEAAGHD